MKVLWFTNIQMPAFSKAEGHSAAVVGGWMSGLLDALTTFAPEVDVAVAFAGERNAERTINGVRYYSIKRSSRRQFERQALACSDEFKPDVVHVHGSEVIAQMLPVELFAQYPTLLSLQGIISGLFRHYTGGLTECELNRFRSYLRRITFRKNIGGKVQEWKQIAKCEKERVFGKIRHIAGRTEWDKAWTNALAPHAHYYHVGEVLRKEFYSGKRNLSDVKPHVIYSSAAMTYPLKGGHCLLEAIALLRRKVPDIRLRVPLGSVLLPMGLIQESKKHEYHKYLARLVEDLNLSGCVELLPSLEASQVKAELSSASMFVLPSFAENSPNALAEAQMLGVPVVATMVGGVPSMLKDGEDGRLVPANDPVMLALAMLECLSAPEVSAKMADNAYRKAVHRHDPETVVRQLISAYKATMSDIEIAQ